MSDLRHRNALALRLAYATGGRVSELVGLCWRDCLERDDQGKGVTGQLTLFGKGDKTRRVLLSPSTWALVREHREREAAGGSSSGASSRRWGDGRGCRRRGARTSSDTRTRATRSTEARAALGAADA